MKKIILLLTALTTFFNISAQEKVKQTEVGLAFSNFDNFGLTLKKGSNKFMWRFSTIALSGMNIESNDTSEYKNAGISVAIGNELKKELAENIEFIFGYDIGYGYSKNKSNGNYVFENIEKSVQINLVLGLKYVMKEHLVLGAELLPYCKYAMIESTEGDNPYISNRTAISYGISNSSARLLIAYRF